MSNVTDFTAVTKSLDQKYREVLEANVELNKRVQALETQVSQQNKSTRIFDKIKERLTQKRTWMTRRSETMADIETVPAYSSLKDADRHPEMFAILKHVRWQLHAVTSAFNLSVRKRRLVKGVSKEFTAYANANPRYLTLMRICMNRYATKKQISAAALIATAEDHRINAATVYRFLKESVGLGSLEKNAHGVYTLSEKMKEDYFFNLLKMLFSKETIQFVALIRRVYAMVDLKLMSENDNVTSRLGLTDQYREEKDTSYEHILKILSIDNKKTES
tara:strand:+ start:1274 stop:2101 length:828 start_codon:yes stop_codon:yes gene_type:complete